MYRNPTGFVEDRTQPQTSFNLGLKCHLPTLPTIPSLSDLSCQLSANRSNLCDTEYWQKFRTLQDEIGLFNAEEDVLLQNELEYRNEIEELYFKIVTILKGNLSILSRPLEPTTSGNKTTMLMEFQMSVLHLLSILLHTP